MSERNSISIYGVVNCIVQISRTMNNNKCLAARRTFYCSEETMTGYCPTQSGTKVATLRVVADKVDTSRLSCQTKGVSSSSVDNQ